MNLEGVDLLSEQDCRSLLRRARVGRVAVSFGEVPVIFPVNYIVAGEEILFFTAEGTKLRAATSKATVTFEVDHIDPFRGCGWSVLVVGQARERTEAALIDGAKKAGLRPWAAGDRFHLVAVAMEFLSGRRVGQDVDLREPTGRSAPHMVGPHSPVERLAQPPVRIGAHWTLGAAAEAMREANVSAVLVGDDEAIVTERDLSRALGRGLGPHDVVGTIAVTDLVSVDEDTLVVDAATHMFRLEIRHLLLRNSRGSVTGVVSLLDVLGVLVDVMDPAVWVGLRRVLSVSARIGGRP